MKTRSIVKKSQSFIHIWQCFSFRFSFRMCTRIIIIIVVIIVVMLNSFKRDSRNCGYLKYCLNTLGTYKYVLK